MKVRLVVALLSSLTLVGAAMGPLPKRTAPWLPRGHHAIGCAGARGLCMETAFNHSLWPHQYVGHDEPGIAFLSNVAGSGNRYGVRFTLPSDPPPKKLRGRSYNFELSPAFWFGMVLCDSQSYPEQVRTCRPDSDSNITPLRREPGSAYMEMQFYPPGWVLQPNGPSCSATKWCAALNIDSTSYDPLTNRQLNDACSSAIGGSEYVNFAFITKKGRAQGPANPIQSNNASVTPNPKKDLFMSSGDRIDLRMFDTSQGLEVQVTDLTSHKFGFMTASKANGFAQVKFATNPSVECTPIPYDFHPMFSTSSARAVLPWAASPTNVAFVDEIGHFDWCYDGSTSIKFGGNCPQDGYEGLYRNRASDYDDTTCFQGKSSSLVKVNGCTDANVPGFDGASYLPDWPDGNRRLHPGPLLFDSPRFGGSFSRSYQHAVFNTDTPVNEPYLQCDTDTGAGCAWLPLTDSGTVAAFYPFFARTKASAAGCWSVGNDIPGLTVDDYGRVAQYGKIHPFVTLKPGAHGKTYVQYSSFQQILPSDPCGGRGPRP